MSCIRKEPLLGVALHLGVLLGILTASTSGCERLETPPRWQEGRCDPDHPCEAGSVCIPETPGGLLGYCLPECDARHPCARGWRCTGRYQRIGTADTFCRQALGAAGAACRDPRRGCQDGLRCFAGTCIRTCRRDSDCPERATRCLPVLVNTVVERERRRLYSACLPVTQAEGKPCKPEGPFCQRGLACRDGTCVRTCHTDADCGVGRRCDGRLYAGPDRQARAKRNAPPDIQYCRKAARQGRSCHPTLDVGCAAGLACIRFRCRPVRHRGEGRSCDPAAGRLCKEGLLCAVGRCRRPCLQDADCRASGTGGKAPEAAARRPGPRGSRRRRSSRHRSRRHHRRRPLRCLKAMVAGQPVKVCQ